jgi:AcrR family transcriptional regulator
VTLRAGPRAPKQKRSLETRSRIVGTTLSDIARESGVSVQSLYLRFGSKPEILVAAFDVAVVGDHADLALLERSWFAELKRAVDGASAVDIFMSEMRRLMERTYPLYSVIRSAAAGETAELLADNKRQRYAGLSLVAAELAQKDGFDASLSPEQAADLLYALVSEDHYGLLVAERAWSADDWQAWCTRLVMHSLFSQAPSEPSSRRPRADRRAES